MAYITTGKLRKKDAKQMVLLQIGDNDFNISRKNFRQLDGEFREKFYPLTGETYFLDRNGDLFEYILQYLRSGGISFPDDFKDGERLVKEAEFFGLKELENHFKNGAGRPEIVTITLMTPHEVREWVGPNSLPKEKRANGTDIILRWHSESSANYVEWKKVTEKFLDKFNFLIYKCEGIEQHHPSVDRQWILANPETPLKHEMQTTGEYIYRDFVFNTKDESMAQFVNCFSCSGFTLMSDKHSTNKSRFNKEYKTIREIKFWRVKPVQ